MPGNTVPSWRTSRPFISVRRDPRPKPLVPFGASLRAPSSPGLSRVGTTARADPAQDSTPVGPAGRCYNVFMRSLSRWRPWRTAISIAVTTILCLSPGLATLWHDASAATRSDAILYQSRDLVIYRTLDRHGTPVVVLTNLDEEGHALAGPGEASSPEVPGPRRSEEHTSELQSLAYLVCRLLLEKKKKTKQRM